MFNAIVQAWYKLCCGERASRPARIPIDRQSGICLARRRPSGSSSSILEPAVVGSVFTLTEFLDVLMRSGAALNDLAKAGSLSPEEAEALLLLSQALIATLEYSEARAHVDRVLLTALSVWRSHALGVSATRALMHRWFWLVFSDARPLQIVLSQTRLERRDDWLLPTPNRPEHVAPCDFVATIARRPRTQDLLGSHLDVDTRETRHNIQAISQLLGSIRHADDGAWKPIWDAWRNHQHVAV